MDKENTLITKEEFGKRLSILLESKSLSQKEFSKISGVAQRNISTAVNGEFAPGFKTINGILKAYEQLNARWLLTGEGSMWCDDQIDTADDDTDTVRLNAISQPSSVILDKAKNEQVASEAAAVYATKSDKDTKIEHLQEMLAQKEKEIALMQKVIDVYEAKNTNDNCNCSNDEHSKAS